MNDGRVPFLAVRCRRPGGVRAAAGRSLGAVRSSGGRVWRSSRASVRRAPAWVRRRAASVGVAQCALELQASPGPRAALRRAAVSQLRTATARPGLPQSTFFSMHTV